MTELTERAVRMLERQPPAVANEISLRIIREVAAIERATRPVRRDPDPRMIRRGGRGFGSSRSRIAP